MHNSNVLVEDQIQIKMKKYCDFRSFKYILIFYATLYISIINVSAYTWVPPIYPGVGAPTSFGSYISFNGGMLFSPNNQYSYSQSLPAPISNLTFQTAILSSFQSQANQYFGYDLNTSTIGNPVTSASLTFKIEINSSFSILGFNIIFISKPFDQVFLTQIFYLNSTVKQYDVYWGAKMPAQTDNSIAYLISFNGISDSTGVFQISSYGYPSTTISKVYGLYRQYKGTISKMKLLLIVLSKSALYTQRNILLYVNFRSEWASSISTTVNLNTDTHKLGTDIRNKCIIGFSNLNRLQSMHPYYKYDISSAGLIVNGYQNIPNYDDVWVLCFTNLQCPSTHPYKVRSTLQCYDCPSNFSDPNCLTYQYGYVFNTVNFVQVGDACIVGCRDCQNHYYFKKNDSCRLCNEIWPDCVTCNQKYTCISCISGKSFNYNSYVCQFCNVTMQFCLNCTSISRCNLCSFGYVVNSTYLCQPCNTTLQMYCQVCITHTTCFTCTAHISYRRSSDSKCYLCNMTLPNCIYCSDQNTCTQCTSIISNLNPITNKCQLCNVTIPYCIQCSDNATCFLCNQFGYLNSSFKCQPCENIMSNCLQCLNNVTCTKCKPSYYFDSATNSCKLCNSVFQYCSICQNNLTCNACYYNYSNIQQKCIFIGCQISYYLQQTDNYICTFCETINNFQLKNGKCSCKLGYFLNYSTEKCQEICGDGLTYNLQCDDGNNNQNDGCNNKCQIMPNYICDVNQTFVYCKYQILLQLEITQIFRLQNKSAIITVKALNNYFPFQFQTHHFISSNSSQKLAQIDIVITQNPLVLQKIQSQVIYSNRKQIQILIFYSFDIQGRFAQITFNTSKTRYICQNDQIKLGFRLKGSNGVLKIMSNPQAYKGISYGTLFNTLITNLLLITGLLSKKFIGLECILTLQLIYYSQLLIQPAQIWPIGFQSLFYLKYTNGYNINLQISSTIPKQSIEQKFTYLTIKKLIIQNYNVSFIILFGFYLVFIVFKIAYAQKKIDRNALKKNKQNEEKSQIEQKQNLQIQQKKQKIINIAYNAVSQISMWSILQVLGALTSILTISNKTLKFQQTQEAQLTSFLQQIELLLIFLSLLMIFFSGLSTFCNLYLSDSSFCKLMKNPQQLNYKRILFVYIVIIGILILFFNQISIYGVKASVLILIFHLAYTILVNVKINPYRNSLKIHRIVLFMQHMIYLIFLLLINLINFIPNLEDIILIAFSYTTTATISIALILTIIRLYYQYRFGQALQIQLKKQQQDRKIKEQNQKAQKLKKKILLFENRAKEKLQKNILQRKQNFYLQQNYRLQTQKQDLLSWLQNRNHLSKQQKQQHYFLKFQQKPLNWIKKNEPQKYKKIIQQRSKRKKQKLKQQQLKINKNNDKIQQYQTNEFQDQFKQLKRKMFNQYKQKKDNKELKFNNSQTKSKYLQRKNKIQ